MWKNRKKHLKLQKKENLLSKERKGVVVNYFCLLGRVLFSLIFVIKPFEHFSSKMIEYAGCMGVPLAHLFVPLWGVLALAGGLSFLLGYQVRIGAWLIVVFLFPATFLMHSFWASDTAFEKMMHHYCFWKNLSLMGAALMFAYFGAGPYSMDEKAGR